MTSHDTCFFTLVIVSAFVVTSMDARSWDVAVVHNHTIHFFFQNKTELPNITVSAELGGLAYDSTNHTVYVTGRDKGHVYLYAKHLNTSEPVNFLSEISPIEEMDYDVASKTLFWSEKEQPRIMAMYLDDEQPKVKALHKLSSTEKPSGIAIDRCNEYIYWSNTYSSKVWSIERSKLDGSDRKVILTHLTNPTSLTIDHLTAKLYWIEFEVQTYTIMRSNLDGSSKEEVYHQQGSHPIHIVTDKKMIYWADVSETRIMRIVKDLPAKQSAEIFWQKEKTGAASVNIGNIMTRDNIDNIDCAAMLELQKKDANNRIGPAANSAANVEIPKSTTTAVIDTVPSTEPTTAVIDTVPSTKPTAAVIDTVPSTEPTCLNAGQYSVQAQKCECKKGYEGSFCERPLCYNFCVHGTCTIDTTGSPKCVCDPAYSGERCEENVCDGFCLNNGQCSVRNGQPTCTCSMSTGSRCELPYDFDQLCTHYCTGLGDAFNDTAVTSCKCTPRNVTTETAAISANEDPVVSSTVIIAILGAVIGLVSGVVAVLSYQVNKLRRRPRIRKRFVVSKGGVTPLTARPQLSSDSCEITIENCCNMNICETPCFEPKLRTTPTKGSKSKKEEKNSLLDGMEGADSC